MANMPYSQLVAMPLKENQIVPKGHHAPPRLGPANGISLGQDDEKFTIIEQGVQEAIGDNPASALLRDKGANLLEIMQAARRVTELHAKPSRRRASFASIPSPRAYSASDSARA